MNQDYDKCKQAAPDAPPADNLLREHLAMQLNEADARAEQARRDLELYTRVGAACRAGLEQLDRDQPPSCNSIIY